MLGSLEDAQDVAQEVFIKLHKHLTRIEPATLQAWLYRTTINASYDLIRRRRPAEPLDFEPPATGNPALLLESEERRRLVTEGLRHLPEKERAAIVLREIEGLDTADVARILGTAEVTVRSQISMGKARLKKWLEARQEARR